MIDTLRASTPIYVFAPCLRDEALGSKISRSLACAHELADVVTRLLGNKEDT